MYEAEIKQQPKRWVRLLTVLMVSLLLLGMIVYSGGTWYINRSMPVTSGTISLKSLEDPVTVIRDENGVPHIQAKTLRDLYVAQGYVTAQDRLFQMDMSRRQASGQLSEVAGEETVVRDKFFRTLGLRRAAEQSYESYSKEAKQVLKWYADGVNLYIDEARKGKKWPIEFMILGYEPVPWTPVDSLTIGKYMAFDLGGHWQGQAFRYFLLQTVSKEKALELFPAKLQDDANILSAITESNIDIQASFASACIPNEFNGSNNWVVGGSKTKSGKPMLANDPHLSLATPAIWYETHLQAPDINVSGVIFPGVPGIILGHNDFIAWGVTNVGPDVQDLYIERRNPDHPNEFLYHDKWEVAQVIAEPIRVKGKAAIDYRVVVTRHGPLISEFLYDGNQDALALKWTALEPSTELEAILRMNRAKSWEEFKGALTYFHTPAQNFVFASKDGTIAYRANGKIPIRQKGDSLLPVPGWTDEYEWSGYIPWEELPTIVNPEAAFIATANHKIADDSYPYHISHTWAQPYRATRISEVLQQANNMTVEDMQKLQMDIMNVQAEEFVPVLVQHIQKEALTKNEERAIALLHDWNFEDDRNSGAPLLFHTWMNEIGNVLFEADIPDEVEKLFEGKNQIVDTLIRNAHSGKAGPWMTAKGGLDEVVTTALKRTVKELINKQGGNPNRWKWGTFHRISFEHPLSSIGPLGYIFSSGTPIPAGGSRVTVQAAGWNDKTGLVNHGASWRFVIDLKDITTGYHIVGPGQSGHIESEWYDDQIKDWVTGTYHETSLYEKSGEILQLIPAQ